MANDEPVETWRVDRKIPVPTLMLVAIQTAGIVWYAAQVDSRISSTERTTAALGAQFERARDLSAGQFEQIVRLDERMKIVQEGVSELKRMVGKEMRP